VVDPDVLAAAPSKSPSLLLLQALFLAGSQMRKGTSYYASSEDYYTRTKALLDTAAERSPVVALAALCIIQWWNPSAPTDISTNTSRFWVTYGIGLAQQVGLHRKSKNPGNDEGLRRRIWWTLYVSGSKILEIVSLRFSARREIV
jgi:Fungal specific transcription factor domain